MPVAGTALLLSALPRARTTGWLLSRPLLVWIGLVSYPLYLWHWPLLSFARIEAAGEVAPLLRLALVTLAFLLAGLTWKLVEQPLRHRLRAGRALALLLPAMAAVLVAAVVVWALRGVESRAGEPVRAYANYSHDWRAPSREGSCSLTGAAGEPPVFAPECIDPPAPDARPTLVLWGDSHAALPYPGLREAAGERLRLAQFRLGCVPTCLTQAFRRESNAWVMQRIGELRPIRAALRYGTATTSRTQQVARLDEGIAALHAAGVRRSWCGPAPRWRDWLPRLLVSAMRHAFLRVPQRLRDTQPEPHALDDALADALAGRDGVRYISAMDRLCDLRGCLTYVDDPAELSTWDYGHLGPRASRHVADAVLDAIGTRATRD